MRFFLLYVVVLFACSSSRTLEQGRGGCKHSCFTAVSMTPCNVDTCASTYVWLQVDTLMLPANYRFISGNKASDKTGIFDSEGRAGVELDGVYGGEYFLEIKSKDHEPLMLESIRFRRPSQYGFMVCLAKGSQLQRYKYLGENKNNNGVLESLN